VRWELAELLEDGPLVLGGDADARVADGERSRSVVAPLRDQGDAARLGVLDRVRQEVEQYLLQLRPVGVHDRGGPVEVEIDGEADILRHGPDGVG
jgi:hypothetical protein